MVTKHLQITEDDHKQRAFVIAKAAGNQRYPRTTTTTVRESVDLGSPEIIQAALAWRSVRCNRGMVVSSIYVHLSSLVFRLGLLPQLADVNGFPRTLIPTPENRKVGGSTPPLATVFDVDKWWRS